MRLRIATVISVAACSALTACGGGSQYASNVKTNFLNACEASADVSTCECALSHVEGSVSVSTLLVAEREILMGDKTYPSWMTDALSACVGK
jgi:5,10-methenyltetrahydromethanopterin hydrogenase